MPSPDGSKNAKVKATFSTPRAAKSTLEELCDRGVDARRIRLADESARRLRLHGSQATADRRVVAMAARAVAVGLLAGLLVGVLLGLVVWALVDVPAVAALMPLAIGGLLVGGLLGGIYRVKENQAWAKMLQLSDLDAALPVTVLVRPADEGERALIVETLGERAERVAD